MTNTVAIEADAIAEGRAKFEDAAGAVFALRERVMAGDAKVTPSMIADAESAAAFAELRIEAAQRQAEEARIAARVAASLALDAEVAAYASGDGQRLVDHLKAAETAVVDFLKLVDARRAQNRDWQTRSWEIHGGPSPAPLAAIDTAQYLCWMLHHAAQGAGLSFAAAYNHGNQTPANGFESAYERLATIDGPVGDGE
jgi:hypothetical protein